LTFPLLEAPFSPQANAHEEKSMKFQIDNMTCGGCARSVTKAIQSVDPQAKIDIDLTTKAVSVTSDAEDSSVAAALEAVGYPPRSAAT
jgi:copper chaperone